MQCHTHSVGRRSGQDEKFHNFCVYYFLHCSGKCPEKQRKDPQINFLQIHAGVFINNVYTESDPEYVKSQVSLRKSEGRVLVNSEGFIFKDIDTDIIVS